MVKNLLLSLALCLITTITWAQWSSNSAINNQVSVSAVDQVGPKIIQDGLGGYIIAWLEKNTNDQNIYIQRLNANGIAQWGPSGVPVCTNPNNQTLGGLVSDGAGGAIVVWEDSTGTGGGGIYGQNDIYAQRISSTGAQMWNPLGVSICSAIEVQSYVNLVSDGSGGAIITWHDYRNNGYLGSDIYAQRINGLGAIQWTAEGKLVCSATNPQVRPRICSDNLGGAFIVWEDYRGFTQSEIYMQHLNAAGTVLNAANGVIMCTAVNDQLFPEVIADGNGGAFLTWYDKRTLGNSGVGDIYGQRINASGAIQWGAAGLSMCNATGDQFTSFANLTSMLLDGQGGFYMAWNDLRNGNHDIYIQRFNGNGAGQWTANGVMVNNNTFNELYPSLALDGNNGVFVTWDRYNLAAVDIYGQRYTSAGVAQWATNGIPLANASNSQFNNQLVTTSEGNAILAFNDKRNNLNSMIYAQKVIPNGTCNPPLVAITTPNVNVCSGSSAVLTANGANTYTWTGLGTGAVKTVFPSVSTTYTVNGVASDGCSATATLLITVNTPPTISITPSATTVCSGSPVTLTANGGQSYVWTNNGATTAVVTVNPIGSTTYTVTGTSSNGCTKTSTVAITTLSLPVISISPTVATICPGGSTTLTAGGAVSYQWTGLGSVAAQLVSPLTTTTYTVTGTASNGCTNTGTRTVNVNSTPNIVVSPATAAICLGQSITLSATGASSYVWDGLGSGSSKTVTPTTTTTYTITGTSSVGCTSSVTKTVTVNPLPVVTITPSTTTICSGEVTSLTADGATTYLWSNNTTNQVLNAAPIINTTYTVTGTSAGCSATSTVFVTVNQSPTISVSPVTTTLCLGQSTTLTATGAVSYSWSNNITGPTQTVTPSSTTTYTVTGTASNGCTNTTSKTVTVNSVPTVDILPATAIICEGGSIVLTATGANQYIWNTTATNPVQTFSPTTTTTYTVTGIGVNGCTASATKTIQVNPTPVVSINPATPTICEGSSIQLQATGAQTYSWNGLGSNEFQTVSPISTTTYTVTGTNASGCTATATKTVSVNNVPLVSISSPITTICEGNTVQLQANGASSYSWNNLSTSALLSVSPTTTTSYTVTGTNAAGCSSTSAITIEVHALPNVTATASQNPICLNATSSLQADGAATYSWSNGFNGSTQLVNPSGSTNYVVTGTDAFGCSATASVFLTVNPLPLVNASSNATSVCEGESVNLDATGADTYSWSNSVTGASQLVTPLTSTTYTVTGTNLTGCSSTSVISISVNPLPLVSASSTANPVCEGTTISLNATGADTYSWSNNVQSATQVIVATTSTTYTVTGTTALGCSATASITQTVNSLPSVSISASQNPVCTNMAVTLTAGGANSYVWSTSGTSSTEIITALATDTYTVTGTDVNGCSSSSSITIVVNPCNMVLDLKAFVQGYYLGGGQMQPVLLNSGVGTNPLEADEITVNINDPLPPYSLVHTENVILNTDGTASVNLPPSLLNNSYYISIQGRNLLETWTANPVLMTSTVSYDFTDNISKAFGDNQIEVEPGVFAIYSGDINNDYAIDAFDYLEMDPEILNGSFGYIDSDLNGDGSVDAFDYLVVQTSIENGVSVAAP